MAFKVASSIEPGVESGAGVESIEFGIVSGYASSSKVPPQGVCHEAKWQFYVQQLAPLQLPHVLLSRFLEKVCALPCHPSSVAIEGWKLILPCLTQDQDWDLPVACWNETEKALRSDSKRPAMLIGLARMQRECSAQVARWLRLSPHNLCRAARRLGVFSPERASAVLARARLHPTWNVAQSPYCFDRWLKQWGPLRPPDWLSDGVAQGGSPELMAAEFLKRQPTLQLDLLHRLLRS
jgi:hypothetical protein